MEMLAGKFNSRGESIDGCGGAISDKEQAFYVERTGFVGTYIFKTSFFIPDFP